MADLGFANIQPVITPASLNAIPAGPLKEMIKWYMHILIIPMFVEKFQSSLHVKTNLFILWP